MNIYNTKVIINDKLKSDSWQQNPHRFLCFAGYYNMTCTYISIKCKQINILTKKNF